MGRGRPFARSLPKLVRGGVAARPLWLATVEKIPPHFAPAVSRNPPRIVYPEDSLRRKYLQAYPEARRLPLDLSAVVKANAHPADRFVAIQTRAMNEMGLSEKEAFHHAEKTMRDAEERGAEQAHTIGRVLSDSPKKPLDLEELFRVSLEDSKTDRKLLESME